VSVITRTVVRPRLVRVAPIVAVVAVAISVASACAGGSDGRAISAGPSLREMVGQLMVVRMNGREPSTAFLSRIRRGEIGGVVLYNDNFGSPGPAHLIEILQETARKAGRPPLLIAVDQEGGIVKRLPGPPSLAPPNMRTAAIAKAQGTATARNLRRFGINTDLAPVLDVGRGGFITSRTFGSTPAEVAARGPAFAAGLAAGRVLATGKHFPGLGYAALNTDTSVETVRATRAQLVADLAPFRAAIAARIPIVMVSSAVYSSLAPNLPAVCSPAIVQGLLRRDLGFHGVVVSDALKTPAVNHFFSTPEAARRAVAAGVDMVLATGGTGNHADTDGVSVLTYDTLLAAARSGRLKQATIRAAYARVLALKSQVR
jgi:beta-N-acetylhexosaminidase